MVLLEKTKMTAIVTSTSSQYVLEHQLRRPSHSDSFDGSHPHHHHQHHEHHLDHHHHHHTHHEHHHHSHEHRDLHHQHVPKQRGGYDLHERGQGEVRRSSRGHTEGRAHHHHGHPEVMMVLVNRLCSTPQWVVWRKAIGE